MHVDISSIFHVVRRKNLLSKNGAHGTIKLEGQNNDSEYLEMIRGIVDTIKIDTPTGRIKSEMDALKIIQNCQKEEHESSSRFSVRSNASGSAYANQKISISA